MTSFAKLVALYLLVNNWVCRIVRGWVVDRSYTELLLVTVLLS
jgi:hypothetical protein